MINDDEFLCPSYNFLNNYTREDSNHSRSFIDHFLLSRNARYTNFDIAHDGHNLSDHHPIFINAIYNFKMTHSDNSSYQIMPWSNASSTNIQNYQTHLDHYLSYFKIPESIENCNNLLCTSHNNEILQTLDELLDIMIISANGTIPTQTIKSDNKGIPGWNTYVKPYKDASILWNDMWKHAGKPANGPLAEKRRCARTKYRWAIK